MNISDKIVWIVTDPSDIKATLQDICYSVKLKRLHLQILGARRHWDEYNVEYYDGELDAIRDAQKRLDRIQNNT